MYKKLCNALLVLLTLSLMVGCKEGSTQSKPFTLQKNKAKTVATKADVQSNVLTIRVTKPDPPNPKVVTVPKHRPERLVETTDLIIQAAPEDNVNELKDELGTQAMGKVENPLEPSVQSLNLTTCPQNQDKNKDGQEVVEKPNGPLQPIPEIAPIIQKSEFIQISEENQPVEENQPLFPCIIRNQQVYPSLTANHVRNFTRNPSKNPSYAGKNVNKLKDKFGEKDMDNEAFIRTVSEAMAKDKKGRFSVKKHNPEFDLQDVVKMCEIQRAYLSDTDFADLTNVLTEKALALLKDKEVTGKFYPFDYPNTAAGIVQYLGEKFIRDKSKKGYEATVEQNLRDILQALDCLVAYNSENKSNIPKTDVDKLRHKFNGIVGSTSSRQVLEYPLTTGLMVRASQDFRATAPPESRQVSRSNTVILDSILEEPESSAQETVSILDTMKNDDDLESKYGDTTAATKGMVDKIVAIVHHLNQHKEEKLEGLDDPEYKEATEKTLDAVNEFLDKACNTLYDKYGKLHYAATSACHNVVIGNTDFQEALKAAADTPTGFKNPLAKIEGDPSNRRLRKRLIALITGCVDKDLLERELSETEDKATLKDIQKFKKHAFFQFRLNGFKFNKKVELESDKNKVFVEVKKDKEPEGIHSRKETEIFAI